MYRGELVFATNNANKLQEARHILSDSIKMLSLKEINCEEDLPETHHTLEENALEKAQYIYNHFNVNCFSEDAGLQVDALNGAPGVYSARYAGNLKDPQANNKLLLENMKTIKNRKAQFRAVIALILNGNHYLFEGITNGQILLEPVGSDGFGYDPVFMPDGNNKSFAQMTLDEKSKISHRKKALQKLTEFLRDLPTNER